MTLQSIHAQLVEIHALILEVAQLLNKEDSNATAQQDGRVKLAKSTQTIVLKIHVSSEPTALI